MSSVLLVLQLIVAIFLVAVILMQRSNGGALSGLGGGDGIGGLLSARSKGNILTRITAVLATLFFVLSLAISIYFSRIEVVQKSVVDDVVNNVAQQTQDVPATPNADVAEVPAESSEPVKAETPAEPEMPAAPSVPEDTAPENAAEPEVPVAE